MSASATITSPELASLLEKSAPVTLLDVRTAGEFETSHIAGSVNVPLDVLDKHTTDVAGHVDADHDVVLVCTSGQRSTEAQQLLHNAGVTRGRVLENGLTDWEARGFDVDRGVKRWELERQVRLVAGSVVLTSVLGSVAFGPLKWLAAGIGGGLTYAALSNTCAMADVLSKLPYNRGPRAEPAEILARLDT